MILRWLYTLALLALLAGSGWNGLHRVMSFKHLHSGDKALIAARMDDAYGHFTAALRWQGSDPYTHVLVGRVVQLAQDNGVNLTALTGEDPANVSALGISAIIRGIALNPADALGWFNLAQAYRSSRMARTRIERLKAMVEAIKAGKSPQEAQLALETEGLTPEDLMVVAATSTAIRLQPEFSFNHDFLAKLYWDRGLEEKAAAEIRKGFALTPQRHAHPWLDEEEFLEGLQEPILQGIRQSASTRFVDPLASKLAEAEVLESVGRIDEAVEAYRDLWELGGPDIRQECDLRLARLYQKDGDYEASVDLLERILAADPDGRRSGPAHQLLAVAAARAGHPEESVRHYRAFLSRRVGSPPVLLDFAAQLELIDRDAEAERIYEGLIERQDVDHRPYERLIQLLAAQRRINEAYAYATRYSQAIPGSGSPAEIMERLGPDEPEGLGGRAVKPGSRRKAP